MVIRPQLTYAAPIQPLWMTESANQPVSKDTTLSFINIYAVLTYTMYRPRDQICEYSWRTRIYSSFPSIPKLCIYVITYYRSVIFWGSFGNRGRWLYVKVRVVNTNYRQGFNVLFSVFSSWKFSVSLDYHHTIARRKLLVVLLNLSRNLKSRSKQQIFW